MKKIAPTPKKLTVSETRHGHNRRDDYAWLKDKNWQEILLEPKQLNPEIRAYLESENSYAMALMSDTEDLQNTLFSEMKSRLQQDDSTVPEQDGAYRYYQRYIENEQHPIYCRKLTSNNSEKILLDGNKEAQKHEFFNIAYCKHSPDHKILGFSVDLSGSEIFNIRFIDLSSGLELEENITNSGGAFVWAPDSKTVIYTRLDINHRPAIVAGHILGSSSEADFEIFKEQDPQFFLDVKVTEQQKFIVISSQDHISSEIHLISTQNSNLKPACIFEREVGIKYEISEWGEGLVALTNAGGAEDFKVIYAKAANGKISAWQNMVPHNSGRLLLQIQAFKKFLVRLELENGLPQIVVRDWKCGEEYNVAFEEEVYSIELHDRLDYATNFLRFTYSSPTNPAQIYDYNMETKKRVLRKTQQVPSGHDPKNYVSCRLLAKASDSEKIPATIIYHKKTQIDGSAPVLLYGYGAYGVSLPAAFSTARLSIIDRGFIYVIAHVRGGTEKGYSWYHGGKLENKKNTFSDFIAVAQMLIAKGFTTPGNIAAHGGSAGGMLIGAVLNMQPDLWKAAVAEVPFVDVLNTMCDNSLPLTPMEWPEWGNPIDSKEDYLRILNYSPYDNVSKISYPNILVTAGLTDPRVTYWEPAKWVAKLRANKQDNNLLLLKTDMGAGHAGPPGRFDRLKKIAFNFAFLLKVFAKFKD